MFLSRFLFSNNFLYGLSSLLFLALTVIYCCQFPDVVPFILLAPLFILVLLVLLLMLLLHCVFPFILFIFVVNPLRSTYLWIICKSEPFILVLFILLLHCVPFAFPVAPHRFSWLRIVYKSDSLYLRSNAPLASISLLGSDKVVLANPWLLAAPK